MATPQSLLGMSPIASSPQVNPSTPYNQISSAGLPMENPANKEQQPTEVESPLDKFLKRFEVAFNSFKDLSATPDYSVAADEANEVKKAMNNWLSAVADKLPTQSAKSGPESNSY